MKNRSGFRVHGWEVPVDSCPPATPARSLTGRVRHHLGRRPGATSRHHRRSRTSTLLGQSSAPRLPAFMANNELPQQLRMVGTSPDSRLPPSPPSPRSRRREHRLLVHGLPIPGRAAASPSGRVVSLIEWKSARASWLDGLPRSVEPAGSRPSPSSAP